MKGYKELGNRYLTHRKKRSFLVAASMVLTTVLIYTVLTLILNYWFDNKAMADEHMNYHAEFVDLDREKQEKIKNYATVKNVDFIYVDYEQMYADYYGPWYLELRYVQDMDQTTFGYNLVEGELPKDSTEILIHENSVYFFEETVKVGDKISTVYRDDEGNEIPGNTFTVSGIFNNEVVDEYAYGTTAFTIATPDMEVSAFVRYDNFADWTAYSETLAEDIGLDTSKNGIYFINGMMETYYFKGDSVPMIAMFLMIMLLVVYMCMVMVRSLFSANLIDNLREFNILKAMGATDKKIKGIFRREIYLEGAIAFVAGIVLSNVFYFILRHGFKLYGMNFDFSIIALLFAIVFMVLTIELAVIEPFGVLKKVPVVEGIKANYAYSKVQEKKRRGRFFRVFGIEGEYAYKNIRRNSKSFWNSVASFTISVLIMTVLVTILANFKEQMSLFAGGAAVKEQYDYFTVMPPVDVTDEMVRDNGKAIETLDYVTSVEPYYAYYCKGYNGGDIVTATPELNLAMDYEYGVLTVDIATVYLYTEEQLEKLNAYMLDGADATSLIDGGVIVVSKYGYVDEETEAYAEVDLCEEGVGDKIKLMNPSFVADEQVADTYFENLNENCKNEAYYEEIEIEGLCSRSLLNEYGLVIIMSYDYVVEHYPSENYNHFCGGYYIDVDEGKFEITDLVSLEQVIYQDAKQAEYGFFNEAKWMEEQTRSVKVVVIFIVIFIVVMGVVSILNNMVNEQQLRKREVSILRSIGMSKKKLNRMLVLEKIIIGLLSWIIGTLLGLGFTRMVIEAGLYFFEMKMVIPFLSYLGIGGVILAIMVLLSVLMVKSMGRTNITEGIRNNE